MWAVAKGQHRIARGLEPRIAIGVMQISNDVARVQQSDEVLRKIRERIDLQLGLAEPERAGFRHSKGGADDTDINVGQIGGISVADLPSTSAVAEQMTVARGKSDRMKRSGLLPLRSLANFPPIRINASWSSANSDPSVLLNSGTSGSGGGSRRGLVRAHCSKNRVAAHHGRLLCSLYRLRKVCCVASGISRWQPHGLSRCRWRSAEPPQP